MQFSDISKQVNVVTMRINVMRMAKMKMAIGRDDL